MADNAETMARDGCQAVVWQTALGPVIAMELLAEGVWSGAGVLGPEAFDAAPFLELCPSTARRTESASAIPRTRR